jgi:hypothetical protein
MSHNLEFQFLAEVRPAPPLLEAIRYGGPIVHGLVGLVLASFLYGIYRACRKPVLTPLTCASIYSPTIFGSALAILQSFIAEWNIGNLGGMSEMSRPDRYVGHIRVYLCVGIAMSAVLFLVQILSARRRNARDAQS